MLPPEVGLPCPSPARDVLFTAAQAALAATRQLPGRTFLGHFKSLQSLSPGLWAGY